MEESQIAPTLTEDDINCEALSGESCAEVMDRLTGISIALFALPVELQGSLLSGQGTAISWIFLCVL